MKYKDLQPVMGVYPLDGWNINKLGDCDFLQVTECEQLDATVFVFQDKYRKLRIDMFFMSNGALMIGDYYGADMKREDMFFAILRGRHR